MGQLITFQDMYQMAQGTSHFNDATITTQFKRDINTGCSKLMAALGRQYTRRSRFADLVASQQYYQYPEDAFKIRDVTTHIGNIARPMVEITDDDYWQRLNQVAITGLPAYYHVQGFDEVGLLPIPVDATSAGLELIFTLRHVRMTKDDYTTGTVTVASGSQTVTGSGTDFTGMVGRAFEVTDGSGDSWYRVQSVESATSMTLENYYQDTSGSTLAYRIGQAPQIPEEYTESAVDYALSRLYRGRDLMKADSFLKLFDDAVEEARSLYSNASDHNVIDASPEVGPGYNPMTSNISINT